MFTALGQDALLQPPVHPLKAPCQDLYWHILNATQVRVRETTHKAHTYISQFNIWRDKQVHPSMI